MSNQLINVHYADLNLGDKDIPFKSFYLMDDVIEHLGELFPEYDSNGVFIIRQPIAYLISHKQEVYVTDDLKCLFNFIFFLGYFPIGDATYLDIFIQEYESFEEAYEVAFMMKETSPICYKQD